MVVEPGRRPAAALGSPAETPLPGRTVEGAARRVSRLVRLLPPADFRQVWVSYRRALRTTPQIERHLASAVEDLLGSPGTLVRAQLAYGVGQALGLEVAAATSAAIAVEYLHSASLVFDDLPSMDDATLRRGRPCPHLLYGEGTAILAGLALVHRAHALVAEAASGLPTACERRAWLRLEQNVGLPGLLDGQARDLHFERCDDPSRVASGKTTPLLRLALLLPAALAGASTETEETLDRLAAAWGQAYQAIDDFRDLLAADADGGKTTHRDDSLGRPNIVRARGPKGACSALAADLASAARELDRLEAGAGLEQPLRQFTQLLRGESSRISQLLAIAE